MTTPDPQLTDLAHQLQTADPADAPALREAMFVRYLELVRGGTTGQGFPYPDPDDPWFEGADAIRALAEALTGRAFTVLAPGQSKPNATALPSAWPATPTLAYYDNNEAAAAGWPVATWCLVLTLRLASSSAGAQIVFRFTNTTPAFAYLRTGNNNGWSPWQNAAGPYGQAVGSVTFTNVAADATVGVVATLPAGRFNQAPACFATAYSAAAWARAVSVSAVSATSITVYLHNGQSSTIGSQPVWWQAVQATSAAAVGFRADDVVDDAVVTCPTEGCENQGVAIAVPTHWADDDGTEHEVDEVVCGVCGTVLTPVELTPPEEP